MKSWKKIVGGTLVVLALASVGVGWHFRNELQAVSYYMQYSQEEQAALEQENEAKLAEVLEQANLPAEIFTDDALTVEEITQKLEEQTKQAGAAEQQAKSDQQSPVQQRPAQQDSAQSNPALTQPDHGQSAKPSGSAASNSASNQTYDAELAAMVGEIYALRSSFIGQLDGLLQQAKAEYSALPPEQREKQKNALASKYIGLAGGLESACDSQMEAILSRIQKHLKETGGDTSLVKEIRKAYDKEKALKKSYYMSMMD